LTWLLKPLSDIARPEFTAKNVVIWTPVPVIAAILARSGFLNYALRGQEASHSSCKVKQVSAALPA
jgi:hypothetical protein